MKRAISILLIVFLTCSVLPVKAAGLLRAYTLPCAPGTYNIIPIRDGSHTGPYSLYAADGITVIAPPQAGNVFAAIPGNAGDNFVIGVVNVFTHVTDFTTITLNGGTSVISASITCACTLGIPEVCTAIPGSDSITGAFYTWTSPGGIITHKSGFVSGTQPPENGTWTVSATLTSGGCLYTLTNSVVLANCGLPSVPIRYNYVRAAGSNCAVKVEWSTAQEQNTDRFEVEISNDGHSGWRKATTLPAAGNSNADLVYSTSIAAGDAAELFVRVKQLDLDGRSEFSTILKVNTGCKLARNNLSILPNTTSSGSTVTIKLESSSARGNAQLIITDAAGRQLLKKEMITASSVTRIDIPLLNFSKGIYFVQVTDAAGNWQSNMARLVVQ